VIEGVHPLVDDEGRDAGQQEQPARAAAERPDDQRHHRADAGEVNGHRVPGHHHQLQLADAGDLHRVVVEGAVVPERVPAIKRAQRQRAVHEQAVNGVFHQVRR
jgi:hypothetical protein